MLREKVARARIVSRLANVPPCLIGGRHGNALCGELLALGHDVRQVPPVYAKPFRQSHKNDFRDAHAIAEAVQRPTTRCVPAKTDEQLDLQAFVGQRLSENEIGRARISMVARSDPRKGRIQKRKTSHCHSADSARNARPLHTVGSFTSFPLSRRVRFASRAERLWAARPPGVCRCRHSSQLAPDVGLKMRGRATATAPPACRP